MSYRGHFLRLIIIIGILVVVFLVVRALLIPESFGKYGHYRGANVAEHMVLPPLYQGSEMCEQCHQVEYGEWKESNHSGVNCEICHGPWVIHNDELKTMLALKTPESCLICHLRLVGRPVDFSQIETFVQHLKDQDLSEEDVAESICVDCHDPHAPL